jgi:cytochrome P450
MTDRELRDEVVTLFLAGHETTALALSYSFYLLATHPEAEARLSAELAEVLRGRPPTSADVPRLRYAEWVAKESMRLYPPAPSIGREAINDCEIGGYHVPKGTQIGLMQWVVHRDPRWFDEAEAFRPERWDNDLAKRLPRGAYFPFGDGPRVCIGNHFAMMETVLILATVLQRYRLELAPGYKLELFPSITLRPKHGVQVVVRERAAARDGQGVPASHAVRSDRMNVVDQPQT